MSEVATKIALPTITGNVIEEDFYDSEYLKKLNIKAWFVDGKKCEDRCALFETLNESLSEKKQRFIHIAMSKNKLVDTLKKAGIIQIV